MAVRQLKVQVASIGGQCNTLCAENVSIRAIVLPEITVDGTGILTGTIVENAAGNSIWIEGCLCYVNFQYDDADLVPDTDLSTCDICLICGCVVDFVERQPSGGGSSITVADTPTIDLTLVGNVLTADYVGPTGGACIIEVTTAGLNALVAGNGLTPGCTYVITNHVQGRIVAGNKIYIVAITTNKLESNCSVLTTYDTKPWRGVYNLATNKITELSDNQGNTCRQHDPFDGFGPTRAPVDEFDWGNTRITNCLVDDSKWYIDYGVAPASGIDRVIMTGGSKLDLRGWTGAWICHLELTNFSEVDFSNSDAECEEVFVYNSGFIIITDNVVGSFLFLVTVADSAFIVVNHADAELYMEGCYVQGYSGVYHRVPGTLTLFSNTVTAFGEIRTGSSSPVATGSFTDLHIENCTITGSPNGAGNSNITLDGDSTGYVYIGQCSITSAGYLKLTDVNDDVTIEYVDLASKGSIVGTNITGNTNIHSVNVSSQAVLTLQDFAGNINLNTIANGAGVVLGEVGYVGAITFRESNISRGYLAARSSEPLLLSIIDISGGTILDLSGNVSSVVNVDLSASGQLTSVGGNLSNVQVSLGLLEALTFDLTNVYMKASGTKTVTAVNNDTGKDFFNDTIV